MIIFEQSLYCLDWFIVYEYPATIVNSDHNLLRNDRENIRATFVIQWDAN